MGISAAFLAMNRLYFGDNLQWLRNTKEFPDASVDLVCLDPPFRKRSATPPAVADLFDSLMPLAHPPGCPFTSRLGSPFHSR
jgi:16S rRNA G966 N2-methylase RsmD